MIDLLIKKTESRIKSDPTICAKALVDSLIELGVENIFGYPGAAVLSIYQELSKVSSIKHYLVRHEQAAVHSAEGYARVSGKPGVVLVTSGPGFTNTVTGIANAYADSTPLVILAGDVSSSNNRGKVFQKVDILSITKTCSKKNYILTSKDDVKQIIKEAYETANSGEKGPVVVVLPRNILEVKYSSKISKNIHKKRSQVINDIDIEKSIRLINLSKKPLILVGGGATNSVENIKQLVAKTNIPVVSTLMGIGVFPSNSDLYLGMIGINGNSNANLALAESDLILSLGVSYSDRSTCKKYNFAQNAKIINVNTKKGLLNHDIEICADSNEFLTKLLSKLDIAKDFSDWISYINYKKEFDLKKKSDSKILQSSFVLETIYEVTQDYEPIVVTDVGQHQLLTAQYFNFNHPKKFITSGGLGTMGFGLPASIGAQIANKNALVINITGDGSFQMNLQELATCREYNIPIKIIILNNGYLGMVRQLQDKIYNNRYQVEMTNPDFTKIAEAYDLFAIRVSKASELTIALEKMLKHQGTSILDIAIDTMEEI